MNNKKSLVILTSAYPFYEGEFFLDDEINLLAPKFDKIYVLCFHNNQKKTERAYPKNVIPISITIFPTLWSKTKAVSRLLKKDFWEEFIHIKKRFKTSESFYHIKIMLGSLAKANLILSRLESFLSTHITKSSETILYAYWHDEMALALSLLNRRKCSFVCIARAHGWDVDYKRHTPPYLPFKKLMIESLNKTYTISQKGKTTFDELLAFKYQHKTEVSRLGKINHRKPLLKKNTSTVVICSCSNIIPLKRIHLIIDILRELKKTNISWVHFGSGPLMEELSIYAAQQIPYVKFEFKGAVSNSTILDYYTQNYIDLFINVSESEGIPVSVMEAQSAGIPVLATDVGGTCEIVNQKNGFIIPCMFSPVEVADMINSYLDTDCDRIVAKRVSSFQNWDEHYNATKNYYLFEEQIKAL